MEYEQRLALLSEDERLVWATIVARARTSRDRFVPFDVADRFHARYEHLGLLTPADGGHFVVDDAFQALRHDGARQEVDLCESPPEELLFHALRRALPHGMSLAQQAPIMTDRAEYRVDFMLHANGGARVAVEVDSVSYHGGPSAMIADRQRDRALAGVGVLTLRFMATEIQESAAVCAYEATEIAKGWLRRSREAA